MQIVFKSATSVTIELLNNDVYYAKEAYNVLLDGKLKLENVKTNVFSIYGLSPDTNYEVSVNDKKISVRTDTYSKFMDVKDYGIISDGIFDNTLAIQKLLDEAPKDAYIYFGPGTYFTAPIFFKK